MNKPVFPIVVHYPEGADYGLLGPQIAATVISRYTGCEALVVGVGHQGDLQAAKRQLLALLSGERPVVGFSYVGGRTDLWLLARELKEEGVVTILAGPQADVDFRGEEGAEAFPHRFQGLKEAFDFALHGPAEQVLPYLSGQKGYEDLEGVLWCKGEVRCLGRRAWDEAFLTEVDWGNLHRLSSKGIEQVRPTAVQVLGRMGCPYAARRVTVGIDYPRELGGKTFRGKGQVPVALQGCSFCDVATDKGAGFRLSLEGVLRQIAGLPEDEEGRKIPFELVDEKGPLFLPRLLEAVREAGLKISRVDLVTRADWLLEAEGPLREALRMARSLGVKVLVSSVGFEAFSDRILRNLNKGYRVSTNISAVGLMRRLKDEFPREFLYRRDEGACHGFIHPTPWDSPETLAETNAYVFAWGLYRDVLPDKSTPLIVHHGSALGRWLRSIEEEQGLELKRSGSIIQWW